MGANTSTMAPHVMEAFSSEKLTLMICVLFANINSALFKDPIEKISKKCQINLSDNLLIKYLGMFAFFYMYSRNIILSIACVIFLMILDILF